LNTLIKENKVKKWNSERVSIYEILCGLTVVAYANYYQKIRFIYTLFDFDGNQAIDMNEIAIIVISFCKGWQKFSGIKIPNLVILEAFAELVNDNSVDRYRFLMLLSLVLMGRSVFQSK
jgi:hypothetical protein